MLVREVITEGVNEDWKRSAAKIAAAGALLGAPLYKHISDQHGINVPNIAQQGLEHLKRNKYEAEHARSPKFAEKLRDIAAKLSVDPNDLLKVMHFETIGTLNPSITNAIGATGLLQFMPNVAAAMGTSTEQLRAMTATQQLDWVYKYFKMKRLPPGSSASDIYLITFMPAVVIHDKADNFILGARKAYKQRIFKGIPANALNRGSVWDQNPVFHSIPEIRKRGYFTVGDVRRIFDAKTANVKLETR